MEYTIWILYLIIGISGCYGDILGKFVFHGTDKINNDHPSMLSILHKPESVNFAPNPGALPANEISSILSLSLGLSIRKDLKWNGLQAGSLFERPKAIMMISLDGIPKGEKLDFGASETFTVKLNEDASSIDEIYTMSSTVSIASHVNSIMDGQSTTLSVSADEKIAAAGYSPGDKTKTAFWSEMDDGWKVVSGDGQTSDDLSKVAIMKRIPSILTKDFKLNAEEKNIIVNAKDVQVKFNLKINVDFNLFSELVFMQGQYEKLVANKASIKDGAPDVYLFALSSLKGIEKQYGCDSKQMRAALKLVQHFVQKLASDFKALYGENILIVGLTMMSEKSLLEPHKEKLHTVLNSLKDLSTKQNINFNDFNKIIPELHVKSKLEKAAHKSLCKSVQGALAAFTPSLKFKCNDHSSGDDVHHIYRRSLLATDSDGKISEEERLNLASTYDGTFAVSFNIWFWLLVLLALSTYAISVVMWNMDPGRDSIIYRLTQQKIKAE